jgi:hypothetical protein
MKIMFAALAAVSLCMSSGAQAENGRNGSALLGGFAGVAIGAAGASLLMNSQPRRTVVVEEEPVRVYEPACGMRMIDLFDREGNFVKKDRVRVCH